MVADDQRGERQARALPACQEGDDADDDAHGKDKPKDDRGGDPITGHAANDQHHRRDCQILCDQNANRNAPDARAELADVTQHFYRHRSTRQCEHETEEDGGFERPAEIGGKRPHRKEAAADLHDRADQADTPEMSEASERQLHADEIEQHEHTKFSQRADLFTIADETKTGRAENNARQDIADNFGLLESGHEEAA